MRAHDARPGAREIGALKATNGTLEKKLQQATQKKSEDELITMAIAESAKVRTPQHTPN